VIAGLSISFPTMRCGADTKSHYVALLKQSGLAISTRLGYREATAAEHAAAEPG
jgi:IclR family transcriptional regulator, KDG regulon repressor